MSGRVRIEVPAGALLQLPAAATLRGLGANVPTFHMRSDLRPPLGIYNTSIEAVTKRLSRVVEMNLSTWRWVDPQAGDSREEDELLERQDALLDALTEHLEDLSNLLLTFFPTPDAGWRHPAVQAFTRDLDAYRTHLGKLDNFIKHKQGRMRLLVVSDSGGTTPGYYAEAPYVVADGSHGLGPSSIIHEGGDTAFSFNRDLRLHGVMLMLASEALARAIAAIVPGIQPAKPATARPDRADLLMAALVAVAALPPVVFVDELQKPWPSLEAVAPTRATSGHVVVELPGRDSPRTLRSPVSLHASMRGDGVTRSFRIPYRTRAWAADA